jgi:general nucleoside transport system ATP-binding protein
MSGIVKRFPGVVANDGVSFEASRGEVHALLGENGAGKSTLSNILTGLYRPDDGHIELDGTTVSFASPRDAIAAGVGMVHQHFRLVPTFTVTENVALGARAASGHNGLKAVEHELRSMGERYGLPVDPTAKVWQLSVGEQQRVEILKVLYHGARILILDEPTAVLTPQEADALFVTLRAMVAEGRTVIFISHKLQEVMAVADRVTVLRGGRNVATVETASTSTTELARLMVGRDVVFSRAVRRHPPDYPVEPLLSVDTLCADDDRGRRAVVNVTFQVKAREIVGVAGVAGNGQRELAEAITGMRAVASGSMRVNGQVVRTGAVRDAMHAGIAHVPEDRLHTGLAASLSIEDNLSLKSYRRAPVSKGPFLDRGFVRRHATSIMERFDVRAPGPSTAVRLLSGGNLQKVLLAREFTSKPSVLVAASPTRGLDVGAIEAVRKLLIDAADDGMGVVLISEDLEEVLALSDRILVMYEGAIVGEVPATDADAEHLGLLMGGSAVSGSTRA